MKKLFGLLLLSPLVFSEMKPLKEYIASIDELRASEFLYVNYRCLGLFGMVINVTNGSSQENSMSINTNVNANSRMLMEPTYKIWASVRKDTSLEAFLGYCFGCKVFKFLMSVNLIPKKVCEKCNDLNF